MRIYLAPMESVTDVIFRATHHACFPGVAKYFIPFISPTQNMVFTPKELAELTPEPNAVPQILTRYPEHFLWAARALGDMGYPEVNLNLGCPSGTVTAKGKGSGMLRDPDGLARFLDEVYAHSPISVSVKTRIGYETPEEWAALLNVFSRYPISELIIHPRTRRQFYKGTPYDETYAPAFERCACPIVCNGDLFTPSDCRDIISRYPRTSALMLGRGLIGNPALAREATGGQRLTYDELRGFHDRLYEAYLSTGNGMLALVRMRMVAYYMASCFEEPMKPWKAIRKARNHEEYRQAAQRLFDEHPLRADPYYLPLD